MKFQENGFFKEQAHVWDIREEVTTDLGAAVGHAFWCSFSHGGPFL